MTQLQEAINTVNSRFVSGNAVQVERAAIRKEEWDIILQALQQAPKNKEEK